MRMRLAACLVAILFGAPDALADGVSDELAARFLDGPDARLTPFEASAFAIIEEVYRERDMRPIWVDATGPRPRALEAARLLVEADRDALNPNDYGADVIITSFDSIDPSALAELEVRLSLGIVQFAADLGQGRTTPHVEDPELFLYRAEVDKAAVLAAVASSEDIAATLHRYRPQTDNYHRLREALADYRSMAELGGWGTIPDGDALKPGMTDARVGLVRDRLRLWGDLDLGSDAAATGGDPDFYDDLLAAAVERMQGRHGLAQDGVIGRNTLAALNVPVEDRIEQIVLNLERRRWMPDDLGRRYIFVNLADYNLKVVEREQTIHDARVVVGRPYHRTPVFSHRMTYLDFNPFWNVPPSIARDLLTSVKADPGYLAQNNYRLFSDWSDSAREIDPLSVDWTTITRETFRYKIRQDPGDGNALGRVKFMLPNRFNVYLHDTPAKSLFSETQRTFSRGCVRVMDPARLAEIVLQDVPGWTRDRIDSVMASGQRMVVTLPEPWPVHISYLTAWVNKDGTVHFRNDIYERDVVLAEALMGTRRGRSL